MPEPHPLAQTVTEFVRQQILEGEGPTLSRPEDVAALESLVKLAGRRALDGLLIVEE